MIILPEQCNSLLRIHPLPFNKGNDESISELLIHLSFVPSTLSGRSGK